MSHCNSERHPLAQRHFKQIVCRPRPLQNKIRPIWAVTWRPGDHTNSFRGKAYRPIGSATMMVQASYKREGRPDGIGLLGIAAQINPIDAVVSYGYLQMLHYFQRVPYVGARGPILDPSDNKRGGRGNGSWVRLALKVDKLREKAAARGFRLPSVPVLPKMFFGYGKKEQAPFEVTAALRRRAAEDLAGTWTANSLNEIAGCRDRAIEASEAELAELRQADQQQRLLTAWNTAFVSPADAGNDTGLWLLPHELVTDVYSTTRIFEYFGDLIGVPVFNPARNLSGRSVPNPAIELAAENGFDLVRELDAIAESANDSPEFKAVEQRLIELLPIYRKRINASDSVSDQDLLCALCDYSKPVAIAPAIGTFADDEQLRMMREALDPDIAECCTDEDIRQAINQPNGPLMASGLCRIQTLARDLRLSIGEGLTFSSARLGCDRVEAQLWHDRWPDFRPANVPAPQLEVAA